LKLVEVLVGFEDSAILNAPIDRIFQIGVSVIIVEVYFTSASKLLVPLHGCWQDTTHLYHIYSNIVSAFQYVF